MHYLLRHDIITVNKLHIWVVYRHPKDFPDKFVARRFILDKPTQEIKTAESLDEIRNMLPLGLICFERHPTDDAVIVETWI